MEIYTFVNREFFHYDIIPPERGEKVTYYQRLKDVREDRNLTQKQIAEVLQIGQSDYSKYERGVNMMGNDKYAILAKYYYVSLDYLTGIINQPRTLDGSPYHVSRNITINAKNISGNKFDIH